MRNRKKPNGLKINQVGLWIFRASLSIITASNWILPVMALPKPALLSKVPALPASTPLTPNSANPPLTGKVTPQTDPEVINQLEQAVRFDVLPNSNEPISAKEAIELQQELESLIGRVESAVLAASIYTTDAANEKEIPSLSKKRGQEITHNRQKALAKAREVAKNIPLLVNKNNYALARQQWLVTKANLWKQFPVNRLLAQPEIRSVWLDRGTIVRAGSEEGLAKIFDRLAQAGINTVFLETINSSYTIYPSRIAPQQNPLIKGWNPLRVSIKLAHQRGMELHAWVWTFAASNQRHNQILQLNPDYPVHY